MKTLLIAATLSLGLSSVASAAIHLHAEGNAFGTLPGLLYDGAPIIVDWTFDPSLGNRLTHPTSDAVGGMMGGADVSLELLPATDWGTQFSSLTFVHSPTASYMGAGLIDGSLSYALFFTIQRSDQLFTSLDILPSGNLCIGATTCEGGIGGPNGPTNDKNVTITWSTVTLTNTAVPEPATWALMILGFGAAGSMIRLRKGAWA